MMTRRGFLGSILALGAAPAIVRADSLMRIVPREIVLLSDEFDPMWINGHFFTSARVAARYVGVDVVQELLRLSAKVQRGT